MAKVSSANKITALGNVIAETVFKSAADATKAAIVVVPGGSKFDGKPFKVVLAGYAVGGNVSNNTITVALYAGKDTTVGNDTKVATTAAEVAVNVKVPFILEGLFVADSTSGKLWGSFTGSAGGTAIARTIQSAQATWDPSGSTPLYFCASAIFGVTQANNAITITDFHVAVDD